MKNHKSKNNPNYIDGRTLKKYYCIDCEKEINYYTAKYGQYRCRKCASLHRPKPKKLTFKNKRHTKKHKQKMRKRMKGIKFTEEHKRNLRKAFAKPEFKIKTSGRNSHNFGKPSPHGKGAYYKNIWMRSSYEIKFAFFLDCSRIKWDYESKTFDLGDTTYTPDFYIPEWDLYIEIKGWWRDDAKMKYKLFKKLYSNIRIRVLNQKDLETIGINLDKEE